MKIPLSWLKEYVKTDKSAEKIADTLTKIGHMQDGPFIKIGLETVMDLEVRQNRSDCLSIVGMSRELCASLNTELLFPSLALKQEIPTSSDWTIEIEDPSLCYRFNSIKIDNLTIAQTPDAMKKRLISYGMEPVNAVVDITNYVMIELGQPLHAFDATKIGNKISVRRAKNKEKILCLNNETYTLSKDDIIIADERQPLAIAGVIGGVSSSITDKTSCILLEGATYNQASIRRTSLRHCIRTEASLRLEKFLHPHLTQLALLRAIYLFKKIFPECTVTGNFDCYPKKYTDTKIEMTYRHLNTISGIPIPPDVISKYLKSLEFEVTLQKNECLATVPYFRTDVTLVEDLIEEVLRMYGYDNIPEFLPEGQTPQNITTPLYIFEEQIRDCLSKMGFDEHILEPLTIENKSILKPIKLENALTSEKQMLRTTLQQGLLTVFDTYKKHRKNDIKIYEIGKIYFFDKKYTERKTLGMLISGSTISYRDAKGAITSCATHLGKRVNEKDYFIIPIDQNTYYIELNIEALFNNEIIDAVVVHTSPLQIVFQDLSLKSPCSIKIGNVIDAIKNLDSRIYSVSLGELPKGIDNTSQILFLKLAFRNLDNSNMDKKDIDQLRKKTLDFLRDAFSIHLEQN